MPWHMVVIPNVGDAVEFGHDFFAEFLALYKATGRGQQILPCITAATMPGTISEGVAKVLIRSHRARPNS
jgi:hypothetical protein